MALRASGAPGNTTLKICVIAFSVIAVLLAAFLVVTIALSNSTGEGFQRFHALSAAEQPLQDNTPEGYHIAFDVSAHPGATVATPSLQLGWGEAPLKLPFATADGMRFTGWYTTPEDSEGAVKVDNNSLELLQLDTNQTLYARFEPRPTSLDTSNPGLPILMYHYFYNPALGEAGQDTNWMDIQLFESHLAYLQANNYYFPTWEEVGAYIRGEILLPEHSIVLTSDDGHESFFRLAAPLVLQYGAKMTSFVVLIDLAAERLQEYDSTKIFIQAHSYDMHRAGSDGDARILTSSYQEVFDDAAMAAQVLGNNLAYCYPYGKTNDNAKQALSDAGVGVALVIENERAYPLCDPMQVSRLRMSDGATADYLASVAY